jgi:autotransporter-associated beta strand protein
MALPLLACVVALPPGARAQGLLGDLNGGSTGGVTPAANVWQQYRYSFTAASQTTNISFVFRNDPSYTALDDVMLLGQGSTINLLANGELEGSGGSGGNGPVPDGWSATQAQVVGTPGMWVTAPTGAPPFSAHSGSGYWYDGAAGGSDGLTQAVALTPGAAYTLTFWLGSNLIPNGTTVDTQVYAGNTLPPGQSYSGSSGSVTTIVSAGCCTFIPSGPAITLASDTSVATLEEGGTVSLGTYTLTVTNASTTYYGVIDGAGNLAIAGGVQTLAGQNTYTGTTRIGPGATLILADQGSIAASSQVIDDGLFDIAGTSGASIQALTGSGQVALGGSTLTVANAGGMFAGVLAGNGGIAIAGGTQTLSGANTYYGTTTIASGATLALAGAGSIANSPVVAHGTLDISGSSSGTSVVRLAGDGSVVLGSRSLTVVYTGVDPLAVVPVQHPAQLAALYAGSIDCVCGGFSWSSPAGWFGSSNTFSGTIGGSGSVMVTGTQQAFAGANTYSGGTVLKGAALEVAGDASLGAPSGGLAMTNSSLVAGGDLATARPVVLTGSNKVYPNRNSVTLAGPIGGSGSLIAEGPGRVTLSGSNSYTGGTAIQYGATLAIASNAELGAAGSELVFEKGILLALGNLAIDRPVVATGGGGLIDPNGFVVSFTGPLTLNSGLYPIGVGQVLFGQTALGFDSNGTLTISDGPFAISDAFGGKAIVVAATGTLRGTGTVSAPTTVLGTLAPGNSPGTLTFTAPLTLAAGSTTEIDIDGTGTGTGAGNYSRIVVTGAVNTVTLGGTLMPLLRGIAGAAGNTYTPPLGQQFQIVGAEAEIAGSYDRLVQPAGLAAGTRFDALYAPTTLTLVVTPAAYGDLALAGVAQTPEQAAVGRAVDAVRPAAGTRPDTASQALFDPLYVLSASAIPAALEQLSPGIYGDSLLGARESWYQVAESAGTQLAARRGTAAAASAPGPAGTTIWANGLGEFQHVGSDAAAGYHLSFGGAAAGIDLPVAPGAVAGVAVAGGSLRTSSGSGATANGTAVQFALYGGWHSDLLFVDGQADYLHVDQDVRRSLPGWGSAAQGSAPAQGGGVQLHGGLRLHRGDWRLEPTVGLSIAGFRMAAAAETTGGALRESIGGSSIASVQSFAGIRLGRRLALTTGVVLDVHGLVGWVHEFADTAARTTASFSLPGAGAFSVGTASIGRDAARIGAGFDLPVSAAVSVYGSYAASLDTMAVAHNLAGGVRVRW